MKNATRLSSEDLSGLVARGLPNDCLRTLFSDLGQADPARDLPKADSTLYQSAAKDGQVWRIRAGSGAQVEERRIRFTGQVERPFAVLSLEKMTLGEMPSCTDLTTTS